VLHPCGEDGFSILEDKEIPFMSYLCSRFLKPEPGLMVWNKDKTRRLNVNRFQILARLSQYFLVEGMSRAMNFKATFFRENQSKIFGKSFIPTNAEELRVDTENEFIDPDRQVYNNSSKTFLPESFTGSPRHLKNLARNALVIVSELGKPTVFITGI
jgi:hypothetical protein